MVTNSFSIDRFAGHSWPAFFTYISDINKFLFIDQHQCSQINEVYNYIRFNKMRLLSRMSEPEPITALLQQWQKGDAKVLDELSPLVYQELHRIANYYMRSERKNHTLQATALINEAFIKLLGSDVNWHNRKHFYAIAAKQMRHILVDYARAKDRKKRGSDYTRITYEEAIIPEKSKTSILEIDDALHALNSFDQRKHDIVELYYFAGLDIKEIARYLDLSSKTIQRELRMAEAWLKNILYPNEDDT
jgi:RNA polymerase sigma factor (TIGR02999 family)